MVLFRTRNDSIPRFIYGTPKWFYDRPWQGLDLVVHPTLLAWLCGMEHCPAGKPILRVGEHCRTKKKLFLFQH